MPTGPELAGADLTIPGLSRARLIGRGGFGVVYSADDEQVGERVAVKILPPEIGERDRARFQRECETMQRVSGHPNVVRFECAGYSGDGRPYVVMELVDGGTLADLIRQEGGLGWDRAVDLILPIVDAVGFAHRRGILHRDIKPQNILLAADGVTPKLADFGIASLEDQTNTVSTGVPASLAHSAPETLDGARDQRSDLYSLASTLYHAVVGRAPFSQPGDELTALVKRVLTAPVPVIDPDRPGEIDRFFTAALAKDPDLRPASSHELRTWIATVDSGDFDRVIPSAAPDSDATESMTLGDPVPSASGDTVPMATGNAVPQPSGDGAPGDAEVVTGAAEPWSPAITGSVPVTASPPPDGPSPAWPLTVDSPGDRARMRELSPLASAVVVAGGAVAALLVVAGLWLFVRSGLSASEPGSGTQAVDRATGEADPASIGAGTIAPTTIAPVDIPDVVGQTQVEVEGALVRLDLRPEVAERDLPVGDERDGTVLSQNPVAGTPVAPGSNVELVVGRACTTVAQIVEAQTIEYIPPRQGEGDEDFYGHGPEVTLLVSLSLTDTEARLTIDFKAIETRGDLTEASGTFEQVLISVPPETPIHSSSLGLAPGGSGPFFDDLRELDGFEPTVVEVPDSQLVSRVTYIGDVRGPEAGTKTMVTVETRPFDLAVVEPGCMA